MKVNSNATIGRLVQHKIMLQNDSVSRNHAEIQRQGDVYSLIDRGSKYGTHVEIGLERTRPVMEGDILTFTEMSSVEVIKVKINKNRTFDLKLRKQG